jgi:hypothetical protein
MTGRSEIGALVAAMALGGVVFAVQQSHESPATLRGPVGEARAAAPAPAAAKSSFPVARRAVAPDLAARRAALRRRIERHQRAVQRRAAQRQAARRRRARPAPRRHVTALPVVVRVQRPVAAPRPVTIAPAVARPAPRPTPRPVVRPAPRPAPVAKPTPAPKPKPRPSTGVSFVDTG